MVDVRVNDRYSNKEIAEILEKESPCSTIVPRSLRLNSSSISVEHDLIKAGLELGRKTYGSPTLSDQSVLSCPSLKLGPGDSTRSHTADEFIYLQEIEEGITLYIKLLEKTLLDKRNLLIKLRTARKGTKINKGKVPGLLPQKSAGKQITEIRQQIIDARNKSNEIKKVLFEKNK